MKKGVLPGLLLFILLLVGCNEHYYSIKDDRLVMCLNNSNAQSVEIFCSFDGFQGHSAKKVGLSTWEVILPYEEEFSYFYVVDGTVFVPSCDLKENDDFGSKNCILRSDISRNQ